MKKIIVKRLVYTDAEGTQRIGSIEYNGELTTNQILGAVHEVGKTQWIGDSLWLMRHGRPLYHITVETFTQYQKSWFDLMIDALRRI